jgi:hypothetical protein
MRHVPLLIASVLAFACAGPAPKTDQPAPSAAPQILITIDAIAPRKLVPFGGLNAMPRLGELVSSGTSYDDAVSTTNLARPAVVTIMTGVSPDRSGVRDNIHDALGANVPTLAEGAQKRGFDTAAFVSTPFVSYSSGLQRGFAFFDGPETLEVGPAQHAPPVVAAGTVADHFKQWLASRPKGKPYFVWVHLADLNTLSVPLPPPGMKPGDQPPDDFTAYNDALGKIDGALGAILDAVRADPGSKDAEWMLAGTHGTFFGEGGRYGDAFWLADETLHVPIVRVAGRGSKTQAHDARSTWLPDVAATLAKSLGVTLDPSGDGVPLDVAPKADRARLAWGYALDDQLAWPPETAVRDGSGFKAATGDRLAVPRLRRLPAERREAVERAGVTMGQGRAPNQPAKHAEAWLRDLQLVRRFLGMNRPPPAWRRSKKLIEAEPDELASLLARIFLAITSESAEETALRDKLLARYPERSEALHWAAHVELASKKLDAAGALLEAAIAVGPVEPEMHYDLACVRSLQGDAKRGLEELDRALNAGYRSWDWIDKDPDLAAVRGDRGFSALLGAHGR